MPRTISLQVPPDAEAGDALTFVVEGKESEIPVPEGSQPGDVLEIQMDAEDEEDTKNAKDSVEAIELANGKTLQFTTALSREAAKEATNNDPNAADDGTYAHPWPSGLAMAQFWGSTDAKQWMHTLFSKGEDKKSENTSTKAGDALNVLELGSGLGIVGMAFAAQYEAFSDSSLPPLGKIVLSDVQEGMALLKHNLKTNAQSLEHTVEAIPLLWTTEEANDQHHLALQNLESKSDQEQGMFLEETVTRPLQAAMRACMKTDGTTGPAFMKAAEALRGYVVDELGPMLDAEERRKGQKRKSEAEKEETHQFELLLASDVLYNTESIPALVATLKRYLSSTSSLFLAVRWRKPQLERSFFEALEGWQGMQWHLVHTLHSDLSWKDYGNPKCEASNRYFHQTMVSVQGRPHSLVDIGGESKGASDDKPLQEQMTEQEAEAFENCHIQIYCLTDKKLGSIKNVSTTASSSGDGQESRKRLRGEDTTNSVKG